MEGGTVPVTQFRMASYIAMELGSLLSAAHTHLQRQSHLVVPATAVHTGEGQEGFLPSDKEQ